MDHSGGTLRYPRRDILPDGRSLHVTQTPFPNYIKGRHRMGTLGYPTRLTLDRSGPQGGTVFPVRQTRSQWTSGYEVPCLRGAKIHIFRTAKRDHNGPQDTKYPVCAERKPKPPGSQWTLRDHNGPPPKQITVDLFGGTGREGREPQRGRSSRRRRSR